jgi:uncharacterized protein (DUF1015 family)
VAQAPAGEGTDGAALAPFAGGVVRSEVAAEVVSPPYDALTPAQRAEVLASHPHNYLGVLRRAEDVPGRDHLAESRAALARLRQAGVFEARPASFYLCRLSQGGHTQVGVVAELPLDWVADGLVLGHEQVRADRAEELLANQRAVGATSSPVVLAHRRERALAVLVAELTEGAPLRSFRLDDGLEVALWAVQDPSAADALRACLHRRRLYVTDGHHRVEAARLHRLGREHQPGPHQHLLGALFAEDQLRVEAFHRIAVGVGSDVVDRLGAAGDVRPTEGPPVPHRQGSFGVAVDGRWYRLDVTAGPDELAPTILQRAVLGPVLGIDDPTRDRRLVTVPGTTDPWQVAERARHADGVGFLVHPVSVGQLMVVADQGRTLPPKSTYFVPKMRSGIFLRPG